jgi:hypothetical protein
MKTSRKIKIIKILNVLDNVILTALRSYLNHHSQVKIIQPQIIQPKVKIIQQSIFNIIQLKVRIIQQSIVKIIQLKVIIIQQSIWQFTQQFRITQLRITEFNRQFRITQHRLCNCLPLDIKAYQ